MSDVTPEAIARWIASRLEEQDCLYRLMRSPKSPNDSAMSSPT